MDAMIVYMIRSMVRPSAWWRRLVALAELAGDIEQQDIAYRLGVSGAAVSEWKNKGKEPRVDAIRKAAKAYGEFTNLNDEELFRELLNVAYPLDGEETQRPPKGVPAIAGAIISAVNHR